MGSGDGGQVTVKADRLLISSGKVAEFPSVIASSAEPGSSGRAGSVAVTAGELELHDGGLIASSTFGPGDGGQVTIQADRLLVAGDGATNLTGIASSAEASSTGAGGTATIHAQNILLEKGGSVTVASAGSGKGGSLDITAANTLQLNNATISGQTTTADAGDATLAVGRLIDLRDSEVTTSVAGGTGRGGNIFVHTPPNVSGSTGSTRFLVLDNSRIIADAHRGTSGNIAIFANQVVRSPGSTIRASTNLSIVGNPNVTSPNAGLLSVTFLDASALLPASCAGRGGRPTSSLIVGGHGGLPPDPGAPLEVTETPQPPPGQQTTAGSPTVSTARPPQAVKPMTVSGIPQPVLGSPHLTCKG